MAGQPGRPPKWDNLPEVLDCSTVAKFLKISPRLVGEMAIRGEIPAVKCGRLWRFSKHAIGAWLQIREGEPEAMVE